MYRLTKRIFLVMAGSVLLGCATRETPPPEQPPSPRARPTARIVFDEPEVQDIDHISLVFHAELDNPRPSRAAVIIMDWRLALNGYETLAGVNFPQVHWEKLAAQGQGVLFPARLELDLAGLEPPALRRASEKDFDEYQVHLRMEFELRYDSGEIETVQASAECVFPRIREPRLSITSITVEQAELINTRLKVGLRLDNPNPFPVELSAMNYTLYGGGRFWAEGAEKAVLAAAARGSSGRELSLLMNFINMRRDLLDQVIALGQVRYRFTGEAWVGAGLAFLPRFPIRFDLAGDSTVIK